LKSILVIGSSGYLGGSVTSSLKRRGANVISTSRNAKNGNCYFDYNDPNAGLILSDLLKRFRPSLILDLAAPNVSQLDRSKPLSKADKMYGDLLCMKVSVFSETHVLHISTTEVDDDSRNFYVDFKRSVLCSLSNLDHGRLTTIKLPRLIGPNEPSGRFISDLISSLHLNDSFKVLEPNRERDFLNLKLARDIIVGSALAIAHEDGEPVGIEVCAERWSLGEIAFLSKIIYQSLTIGEVGLEEFRNKYSLLEKPFSNIDRFFGSWKLSLKIESQSADLIQATSSNKDIVAAIYNSIKETL
jgi:hypothetical protein